MTPEEEARIRELRKRIAEEEDPTYVDILAVELEHLLSHRLDSRTDDEKPQPVANETPRAA